LPSLNSVIRPSMRFCNVWGAEVRYVLRPTWDMQKRLHRRWTLSRWKSEE
jgi:hypothetical protein